MRPDGLHDAGFFHEIERLLAMGENALDVRDAGRYAPMILKPFPRCFRRWERCMRRELAPEL